MTALYPDARTWAEDHSLADIPRLARLEGFAFQHHPEIVATFGADGAAMAKITATHRRSPGRRAGNALLVIVGIILALAPILGVAIYVDAPAHIAPTAQPLSAEIALPVASICFMISAGTQLGAWIAWIRGGARWSPLLLGVALVAAVLAGFALIGLPRVASRDGVVDVGIWIWPLWLTLVLSVPLTLGILLRRKFPAPEAVDGPVELSPVLSDIDSAQRLVRALPASERTLLQNDRDQALHILARRGLLESETLRVALATNLGTLFTLDPIRKDDAE